MKVILLSWRYKLSTFELTITSISLAMSEDSSANPISNFTNGYLGYFSAYSSVRMQIVFKYDEVEED